MTGSELHGVAGTPAAAGTGVMATATFMVSNDVVATADLLCCDGGEFNTVTLAWPDAGAHVVIAGTRHDLTRVLREALTALGDDPPSLTTR